MPEDTFEDFFADDFPRLVGFLISMGYGSGIAGDAAAEAMAKAHERWVGLDQPRAWVRVTAKRLASAHVMRDLEGVRRAVEGGWLSPIFSPDPTCILEAREQREELLKDLPDRQREVMAWTFDGFEPTEIADALEMPPATVRSHLRHAREKLKIKFHKMKPHTEGGSRDGN